MFYKSKNNSLTFTHLIPFNDKPSTVEADFSSEAGPEKLANFVKKNYNSVDVLINNAGSFKDFTCLKSDSYEEFKRSMQVNFNSAVQLTTSLVPMLQNSTGCIVNVSSNLAIKPSYGTYAYSAAKAALRAFTKSLSIELAPLVRVNSVSPGPISTLMAPRLGMSDELFRKTVGKDSLVGRVGEADEVASVILFLVSNESKFITGSDILIDGGCLLKPSGVIMGTR